MDNYTVENVRTLMLELIEGQKKINKLHLNGKKINQFFEELKLKIMFKKPIQSIPFFFFLKKQCF